MGQGFAEILRDKATMLQRDHAFNAQHHRRHHRDQGRPILAPMVWTCRGAPDRGDSRQLRRLSRISRACDGAMSITDMISAGAADALVEVSPTDLDTAQPALACCQAALDAGLHLVLANKGPVALAYSDLKARARARNLQMRYEATVMAGTPVMSLAEDALAGCEIRAARGILNGTTNYILTQMESGMSYADALAQAQALGYAETDPSGDVEGWDAAGKVLILANALFGSELAMSDLDVSGITEISAADIADAEAQGQRFKLIAAATPEGGEVRARRLPVSDPLASVGGATNAITLETDLLGAVTLIGAGAGKRETGAAILADLLAIHRTTRGAG